MKWVAFVAAILFLPQAYALQITEVMANPEGNDDSREWVEIYSEESANATGWKLVESGKNHNLAVKKGGIEFYGYAVVADDWEMFLLDYPDFDGILFDSSFSLSNSGETLEMKSGNDTIVSVSYNSVEEGLSWCNGSCNPTPGKENSETTSMESISLSDETSECSPEVVVREVPKLVERVVEKEKRGLLFYVDADGTASARDNITSRILVVNQLPEAKAIEIQSYVHNGSQLKSLGYNSEWYGGWAANRKNLTIEPESMKSIELLSKVESSGDYNLRVKIKHGGNETNIDKPITISPIGIQEIREDKKTTAQPTTSRSVLSIIKKLLNG